MAEHSFHLVRDAYSARARDYIEFAGNIELTHHLDQQRIATWASLTSGLVVDAGCGPGQWTGFLHAQGAPVLGVDLVPEFITAARESNPELDFHLGDLRSLPVAAAEASGVLAWYSLIHLAPDDMPSALAEFARVIGPGGRLLIGFFDGPEGEPFEHGVTTAYYWTIMALEDLLIEAGFVVTDFETRTDPGRRPHASIAAVRA